MDTVYCKVQLVQCLISIVLENTGTLTPVLGEKYRNEDQMHIQIYATQ